jgi:hypothetical protein
MTSAAVVKDCIELPGKYLSQAPGVSDPPSVMQAAAALNTFEQCWQGCTYRSMGDYSTDAMPESFELIVTPFYGAMPAIRLTRFKASENYADLSPTIVSMGLINWVKVKQDLGAQNLQGTLMDLALSTVMFTALLSAPIANDDYPLLRNFLFPIPSVDTSLELDFWSKMAGCAQGRCPVFACGDFILEGGTTDVMSMYIDYPNAAKVEGTVDGEAVPGGGCGPPFIVSYIKGLNSTEQGDEVLGAGVSLSLLNTDSKTQFTYPPVVGPVEDYVSSSCPHTHMGESSFENLVQDLTGISLTATEMCLSSGRYDVTSSRFNLGISEVYHFDSNVIYMPAAMEVFAFKKFEVEKAGYGAGGTVTDTMKWLLMLKLRYVDSAAGGTARMKLDILNNQNSLSTQCDTADPSSFSLSKRTSWGTYINEASPPSGTREAMCYYASIIQMITQMCQLALNRDIISGLRESCNTAYMAVMAKVSTVCVGDCDRSMLAGFLCTSVNAAVGSDSCGAMDVMSAFLGTSCSAYQQFVGAYCSTVAFYTGSGFGYSPMSGLYYSTYASNPWSFYYGSGMSNVNVNSASSYSYFYTYRNRQLSIGADCGSQNHEYSTKCLEYVSYDGNGADYFAMDSSVDTAAGVLSSGDDDIYFAHAMAKLTDAFWHISPTGRMPVTILTLGIAELIESPSQDAADNTTKGSYELLTGVGKFLATVGTFYSGAKLVPIFPACDAEFEESVVRDAVQVATAGESACVPYSGGKTLQQVRRNLDVAEARFKALPVSNFIQSLFEANFY